MASVINQRITELALDHTPLIFMIRILIFIYIQPQVRIFVMPISVFLVWPALHAMYGLKEHRSSKIAYNRRITGRILLFISACSTGISLGLEHGFFIWLFALMAIAIIFVQLRIWQPRAVSLITALSLAGFIYQGIDYVR